VNIGLAGLQKVWIKGPFDGLELLILSEAVSLYACLSVCPKVKVKILLLTIEKMTSTKIVGLIK